MTGKDGDPYCQDRVGDSYSAVIYQHIIMYNDVNSLLGQLCLATTWEHVVQVEIG